jgi:anti-anti-sigma factor
MIRISTGKQGGAAVLQVSGRIDAATAPEFERGCAGLVSAGEKLVVLDLGGLQYISSAGLRSLLVFAKTLQQGGGVLRLANLTGVVAQILDLSGFSSMFSCFDSLEAAVGA